MHLDRSLKFVLTMIVICIGALLLTQVSLPSFGGRAEAAESLPAAARAEELGNPSSHAVSQQRFWATLPLRWQVSSFKENVDAVNATFCSTVISVRNMTTAAVTVEVEWYEWTSVSKAIRTRLIPANREFQFASDSEINLRPYSPENDANLINMNGYAKVHADDNRILATADLVCRDGTASDANLVAIKGIPTSAVGSTMEFFQAATPTMGGPQHLADPEPTR